MEKDLFQNVSIKVMHKACINYVYKYERYSQNRSHKFWLTWYYEYFAAFLMDFKYRLRWSDSMEQYRFGIAVGTLYVLTWILGPVYVLSRFFNALLPLIFLLYLWIKADIILFIDVETFQIIMWCVDVIFSILWWIVLGFVIKDEYYIWYFLPNANNWYAPRYLLPEIKDKIEPYYGKIVLYPIVEELLDQVFGPDIAPIVMNYYRAICDDYNTNDDNSDQGQLEIAM